MVHILGAQALWTLGVTGFVITVVAIGTIAYVYKNRHRSVMDTNYEIETREQRTQRLVNDYALANLPDTKRN